MKGLKGGSLRLKGGGLRGGLRRVRGLRVKGEELKGGLEEVKGRLTGPATKQVQTKKSAELGLPQTKFK